MSRILVATLIGLFAGMSSAVAQLPPKVDTRDFFVDLTERRAAAYIVGDRAFYEKLLSADFVMVGDNGVIRSKKEYLDAEFANPHAKDMKPFFSIGDFRVITQRKEFVVVSYMKTEGMKIGEQSFSADARRLDTYALEQGQWRLINMVASRVLKPPKAISLTADELAAYVGTYSVAPGIESEIIVMDGKLVERSTDQQPVSLLPVGYDAFFDPEDSPTARTVFRRDASGKVVAWVYVNGDQEVVARKSN